jgi:hypothetical protein
VALKSLNVNEKYIDIQPGAKVQIFWVNDRIDQHTVGLFPEANFSIDRHIPER